MPPGEDAPLIVVLGPTASGKSELALRLAQELAGEVVNADSVQLYRFFDIGTAKLAPEERVRVPHHLIDILEPDQVFTAGDYIRMARPLLKQIVARGHVPIVCGGTGFYARVLLEGLFPGPGRDPQLRQKLLERERRRPGLLHRFLRRRDPEAARRIHPRDVNKLIRAVEVCLLTGRPMTELFRQGRDALAGYRPLKLILDPPRPALYERINRRTRLMFERGLLEEVQKILAMGYSPELKPFGSLGYRQALAVLRGQMSLEEAIEETQKETRHYAKRQWTWFRREKDAEWVPGFGDDPKVQEQVLERARQYLGQFPAFSLAGAPRSSV